MSNYLNTRDLYKRQCELQEELDDLESERDDAQEAYDSAKETYDDALAEEEGRDIVTELDDLQEAESSLVFTQDALSDWLEENKEELDALNDLENEIGREWMHGATLIPEDDFKNYAQEAASDQFGNLTDKGWPFNCIDWDQAADELRQDYTEVDFQGETYLF